MKYFLFLAVLQVHPMRQQGRKEAPLLAKKHHPHQFHPRHFYFIWELPLGLIQLGSLIGSFLRRWTTLLLTSESEQLTFSIFVTAFLVLQKVDAPSNLLRVLLKKVKCVARRVAEDRRSMMFVAHNVTVDTRRNVLRVMLQKVGTR